MSTELSSFVGDQVVREEGTEEDGAVCLRGHAAGLRGNIGGKS